MIVLLYAAEARKMMKGMLFVFQKQTHLKYTKYISNKISVAELLVRTGMLAIYIVVKRKMEVDWKGQRNAAGVRCKSSHALDSCRQKRKSTTKRD